MKVTKYFTATGTTPDDLDRAVNSMLQKGYQPYGSPYDVVDGPSCQAMVKFETAEQVVPPITPGVGLG